MTELLVTPAERGLRGEIRPPGDKSISHRALLLAALAEGRSELQALSTGADVVRTAAAIEMFGAGVTRNPDGSLTVDGGTQRLGEPLQVIDVGNSGTGIRLLAGWAAARPGLTVIHGDASVTGRPMARVVEPLRRMGARVDGRADGRFPPLVVRGGSLQGIDYRPPVASAQVKGAILLAGLGAAGETTVREAIPTRAHTEELLGVFGADVRSAAGTVTVTPSRLAPVTLEVPGDPSQAAFWVVAATLVPDSELVIRRVYVGAVRAGFIEVLRRMGAEIRLEHCDPRACTADLRVTAAPLHGTDVRGDEIPGVIDEIPALAVAAAYAEGTTTFADAGELKVKESDRVATITSELTAVGGRVEPLDEGLVVHGRGGRPLVGGRVHSHGDHRIAMALAVAGLVASGPVSVAGWEAVATSYPAFEEDMRHCVS